MKDHTFQDSTYRKHPEDTDPYRADYRLSAAGEGVCARTGEWGYLLGVMEMP